MKEPTDNPNASTHLSDALSIKNIAATLLRTPGVRNVEGAYSRGGGAPSHMPGAGTKTGSEDQIEPRSTQMQGVGSEKFQATIGDQKPEKPVLQQAAHQMLDHTDKGPY